MTSLEQTIDVAAPVRVVYDQWTQFELFPRFMMNVRSVRQLDASHLVWEAQIGGKVASWTAEITHQEPDRVVAWRSTSGVTNAGRVSFEALDAGRTRITLAIEYEPDGLVETVGAASGLVARRVMHDLEKFKELVEHTGRTDGGWRGSIEGGAVTDDG